MLPQKILKSILSQTLLSAPFHEIFLQNSISFKCKKARFFLCFQHFLRRVPDWHQVDGYPEFRIALILPHPHLPATSPAMAGFQFLTLANTVLPQDFQIQLQL